MLNYNPILDTDSYKFSHFEQYPEGTEKVYSYVEARGGAAESMFFGMQAWLQEYMSKPITMDDLKEAKQLVAAHGLPFNEEGFKSIIEDYDGYWPVTVASVDEGTVMPTSNVQAVIYNTDPRFYWVPSFLETQMLRAIWYPSTVATISFNAKRIISQFLNLTADDPDNILPNGMLLQTRLHDFGARGVSSYESAGLGGLAHLVNFMGTDTVTALQYARKYYLEDMAGYSIPAAEHSTMTALARDGEAKQMERMIDKFSKPGSIYAVVSDSYDIYNAVSNIWGDQLKQKVIDNGGLLVVRPDSGHPATVVNKIAAILADKFGFTVNSKGYKVLNYVRIIQGDGINLDSIEEILATLKESGFSAENIAFGMGGGLLQHVNRDTLKYAMKASAMWINGKSVDVYKDPVTDSVKKSKRGVVIPILRDGNIETITATSDEEMNDSLLKIRYQNGRQYNSETLATIRKRAASYL